MNRLPADGNLLQYNILAPIEIQIVDDEYRKFWNWVEEAVVERAISLIQGEAYLDSELDIFNRYSHYYNLIRNYDLNPQVVDGKPWSLREAQEKIITGIEVEAQKVVEYYQTSLNQSKCFH